MDINSLDQFGRVEKEIKLDDKVTIKLHTLSVVEQQKAFTSIPKDGIDEATKYTHLQLAVLIQATDSINGVPVEKEKLKELYSSMQYNVLANLFAQYLDLTAEQNKVLDELKKK